MEQLYGLTDDDVPIPHKGEAHEHYTHRAILAGNRAVLREVDKISVARMKNMSAKLKRDTQQAGIYQLRCSPLLLFAAVATILALWGKMKVGK
ncbi:hypothetical protein JCM11641_001849 [Rhodosporidiobolus odoratus]